MYICFRCICLSTDRRSSFIRRTVRQKEFCFAFLQISSRTHPQNQVLLQDEELQSMSGRVSLVPRSANVVTRKQWHTTVIPFSPNERFPDHIISLLWLYCTKGRRKSLSSGRFTFLTSTKKFTFVVTFVRSRLCSPSIFGDSVRSPSRCMSHYKFYTYTVGNRETLLLSHTWNVFVGPAPTA